MTGECDQMGARRPDDWDDRVRTGRAPCRAAGAPTAHHGGEANLVLPDLRPVSFLAARRAHAAPGGHPRLGARPAVRAADLTAAQDPARPRLDARGLRADLRDLQDLPAAAGQVPADPLVCSSARSSPSTSGGCVASRPGKPVTSAKVGIILLFSLVGIAGSYGVAWFGIRVNTFANSRTAFASLAACRIPLRDSAQGRA